MQFTLRAAASIQAAPFCIGYAFKAGDIPAGSTVLSDYGSLQVTPRTYWPDGSLKFALLAGQADLTVGTSVRVKLRKGTPAAAGAALTLADLKATGVVAQIGCGTFGTARWANADWDQPFQTWATGPLMSSWIFRKAVGTDAHLVAWMEVRLFAGGAVEVLPWIENGYLQVAAPTNKSSTYTFTLGTTQRFSRSIDLKHHQRTVLIDGAALAYWLGNDPGVGMRHDTLYLQATELVPTYSASLPASAAVLTTLPVTYVPLQAGNFSYDGDYMPSSGYADPIGVLPLHDVLYLAADSGKEFDAVVRNGYGAGRYGIHYRDENTNRPLKFSQWANLAVAGGQGIFGNGSGPSYTTAATGGNPPVWDLAHSPSVGFMAYLLTGRFYFMEEVQFAATLNGISVMRDLRANGNRPGYTGASCLFLTAPDVLQTRASAWGIRTLAQALCVTPPTDSLYADLLASMEDNCRYFHSTYVAQPNNPYGFIQPGEAQYSQGTTRSVASWQQDFVTAAWGYARAMGLPLSDVGRTRLSSFFDWKAKSVIFRLGPSSGFWYVNANPYTMVISTAPLADYVGGTGPWYRTDAEVYAATYPTTTGFMSSTEGSLGFDYGSANDAAKAMWANLQPAIAYALRFGVPGAKEAYRRMTDANNWPALAAALNARAVWAVKPATTPTPAWLQGAPLNRWFTIPGTAGPGAGLVPNAFCDMTLRPDDSSLLVVAAGGHLDGSSNAAAQLVLSEDAPAWITLRTSSTPTPNVLYYDDGRPTSRHTYHHTHYIASRNAVLLGGCRFGFGSGTPTGPGMDLFSLSARDYLPRLTFPDIPVLGSYAVAQDGEGNLWTQTGHKFTVATATWSKPGSGSLLRYPAAYDVARNRVFALQWADGEGFGTPKVNAAELDPSTGNTREIILRAGAGLTAFQDAKPTYAGMAYCPVDGKFYFVNPAQIGQFYVVTPNDTNTWDIEVKAAAGIAPVSSGLLCKRFLWVPALNGFVLQSDSRRDLLFMRMA